MLSFLSFFLYNMVMKRVLNYNITPKEDGMSIRDFLSAKGYSHAVLVQLKKTESGILRNGVWSYVTERLHTGDTLVIHLEENDSSQIVPVALPLTIIYEDADILVLDKPADMPIHPSMNHYDSTLANGVMHYFTAQGIPYTFRCVNRLDRDTTGLTVIAKHMLSSAVLSRAILHREIHRTYLAIAEGEVNASGTIDAPIARKPDSILERMVSPKGESAVTHYKRIAFQNGLSLVALRLETGRTHQIRVHMKYIGHPLIGDFLYHPDSNQMARQALHSFHLAFTHPVSGAPMSFTAKLPEDMCAFFPELSEAELLAQIRYF